jgi:hypothetical protein
MVSHAVCSVLLAGENVTVSVQLPPLGNVPAVVAQDGSALTENGPVGTVAPIFRVSPVSLMTVTVPFPLLFTSTSETVRLLIVGFTLAGGWQALMGGLSP